MLGHLSFFKRTGGGGDLSLAYNRGGGVVGGVIEEDGLICSYVFSSLPVEPAAGEDLAAGHQLKLYGVGVGNGISDDHNDILTSDERGAVAFVEVGDAEGIIVGNEPKNDGGVRIDRSRKLPCVLCERICICAGLCIVADCVV